MDQLTITKKTLIYFLAPSVIFIIALILRWIFAMPMINGDISFIMGDDDDYHRLAISFVETGKLLDGNWQAYRMPVFPLFLAGIYFFFGRSSYNAYPIIVVLAAIIPVMTYFLGKNVFNWKVGLLAGLICAFDIHLIFYSIFLLTETLFVFLVLTAMFAFDKLQITYAWQWAVITGILFGLANLTRTTLVFSIPFLLVFLIWNGRNKLRVSLINSIIIIGFVGTLWGVWVLRNFILLNTFIPLTTQSGHAYYPIYNDIEFSKRGPLNYGRWEDLPLPDYLNGKDEISINSELQNLAITWIRDHPVESIKIAFMQPLHLWQPDIAGDPVWVLVLFSIPGLLISIRKKNLRVIPWVILIATSTVFTIISIAVPRFRLPLHPFLAILAAYFILALFNWRQFFQKENRVSLQNADI